MKSDEEIARGKRITLHVERAVEANNRTVLQRHPGSIRGIQEI